MPHSITLIASYYRQPLMLAMQLETWARYSRDALENLRLIVVDDGSPPAESALSVVSAACVSAPLRERLQLYRIDIDIPWNREGARNLGATVCETEWMIQLDIDHLLENPDALLSEHLQPERFYRLHRWRIGRADDTRRKDKIDPTSEFGQIHPHIDSYLVTREAYWQAGGYNEDFAGVLGGGTDFLRRLESTVRADVLPLPSCLHVVTSHVAADASDRHCSRDRTPGKALQRRLNGRKPTSWLRFPWQRLI